MSEPSSTDTSKPDSPTPSSDAPKAAAPKKPISPVRHLVGLVVLIAVLAVGWLEYSAKSGYNAAVNALDARTKEEDKELMTVQEAESLLGKAPDGPATDVEDGGQTFAKKTYTWRGLVKSYPLTAFYTKQADSRLHHFETEGAHLPASPPPPSEPTPAPASPPPPSEPTPAPASPPPPSEPTPAPPPTPSPAKAPG
jgi:hypothetical protein